MIKSLFLVLPATLLVSGSVSATPPTHRSTAVASSRSVSHNAHEAWFRQSIGDILEGRVAAPTKRTVQR